MERRDIPYAQVVTTSLIIIVSSTQTFKVIRTEEVYGGQDKDGPALIAPISCSVSLPKLVDIVASEAVSLR